MCTVLLLHRVIADRPLIIAANRDEYKSRPASPPVIHHRGSVSILAGTDLRQGGTWCGVNNQGVFAIITNQRTAGPPNARRRSRGELVMNVLSQRTAEGAVGHLRASPPGNYNPYNLLFGTGDSVWVAYGRDHDTRIEQVPAGIHVLPNDELNASSFHKVAHARARLAGTSSLPPNTRLSALVDVLADETKPNIDDVEPPPPESRFSREQLRWLDSVYIRGDIYGTCSSTIIEFDTNGPASYRFCEGEPSVSGFAEYVHTLAL